MVARRRPVEARPPLAPNDDPLGQFPDPAVRHMPARYIPLLVPGGAGIRPEGQLPDAPLWNYGAEGYIQPPAAGIHPGLQQFAVDDFLLYWPGDGIPGFDDGLDAMQGMFCFYFAF